jgi:hypothetical protein
VTTFQAIILGVMLSWTPSVVLLTFLLWYERVGVDGPESEWHQRY